MNPEAISGVLENIDEEELQKGIRQFFDEKFMPEMEKVRERAEADASPQEVREEFSDLSDDRKNEYFHSQLQDLIYTLILIRLRPIDGFRKLKQMIRDPYVQESLLLIFEHEYIDDAGSDELKQFAAEHLRMVGVAILPEMYDEETRREVLNRFDIEDEVIDEYIDEFKDMDMADLRVVDDVAEAVEEDD